MPLDKARLLRVFRHGGLSKSVSTALIDELDNSSALGAPVVRAFPFSFDTPGLRTGHEVYTPAVGEVLLDAWLQVDVPWDGANALCDIGGFGDGNGILGNTSGQLWRLSDEDRDVSGDPADGIAINYGANYAAGASNFPLSATNIGGGGVAGVAAPASRTVPAVFTAANPVLVVVSQDGSNSGASPGATQGEATLYLVTCTPIAG